MGATKFSTEIINRKQSGRSFTKKCKLWSNVPVTPNTKLRKHPGTCLYNKNYGKKSNTNLYTSNFAKSYHVWSWEPLNLVQKLSTGSNPEGHLQRSANSDLMFQLLQIQSYVNIQFRQKLSCVVMGATKFSTEIINRKQSGRSFTKKCKLWSNVPVTPNTKLRKHPISPKVIMCGHGSH